MYGGTEVDKALMPDDHYFVLDALSDRQEATSEETLVAVWC